MRNKIKVAADIGGTFTDIALILDDGQVATVKIPSTPDDYSRGIISGIAQLIESLDVSGDDVGEVLHGCTVATNTILENAGAKTALITTRGFRDVLELRRIRIPRLYDPLYVKPQPLAPRELRFEVTERMDAFGNVLVPLAKDELSEIVERIRAEKVEAVAVCFLHSCLNPVHEREVEAVLRRELPGVFVTISSFILPEIKEYERTSTAVINSYVGPVVADYVRNLIDALKHAKLGERLFVMQSSGGILDAETVIDMPARIIECGPAAGVIGAAHQAALSGYPNVITFDMGGTTAKAAMIENHGIVRTDEYEVGGGISLSSRLVKGGGYALKLPVIDISEVGAGGGSTVWFDRANVLKVGPESAGAVPGPACYGAGGVHATVTDCNVVLGFLNPEALAGGTVPIKSRLAMEAVEREVADKMASSLVDAAWAVFVVATSNMMRAVKAVSTYRGRDPRDCVLMAFGGNGGIFAAELARQLQMKRVLVPPAAGVFSAVGLCVAPIEFTQSKAFLKPLYATEVADLTVAMEELTGNVLQVLGYPADMVEIRFAASVRYIGQAFELSVPLSLQEFSEDRGLLRKAFEEEHERTYGHRLSSAEDVEIVALEVTGKKRESSHAKNLFTLSKSSEARSVPKSRQVYFGPDFGTLSTEIRGRSDLSEKPISGPLIIEEYEGTTVVPPDAMVCIDRFGNIVLDMC